MYLDNFKVQFAKLSLAFRKKLSPCTEKEISSLEEHLGLSLPLAYKEFLLWGGHSAGGLMEGSDCFFKHLLLIQDTAKDILAEDQFSQLLPEYAFVFFMHQDYQFLFFKTFQEDDPPVYSYREHQKKTSFKQEYYKYSDFLTDILEKEAEWRMKFKL